MKHTMDGISIMEASKITDSKKEEKMLFVNDDDIEERGTMNADEIGNALYIPYELVNEYVCDLMNQQLNGDIHVVVCSGAMSKGVDIKNFNCVINNGRF
uniref:Helicase C-terminal domain-containing protein n=1 Tax=Parastrongyloides trichosuri TaxID=131310 RepID=A0A0N4Z8M1_PARTI